MHRHRVRLKERLRSVARATPGVARTATPHAEVVAPAATPEPDQLAVRDLRQAIVDLAASLAARHSELAGAIAQASVELAVQIAERLLGAEVAANRQRLDQIVLASLERIQASRAIAIKANPLDLQLLQRQLSENALPDRYAEVLSFQRDDGCPRGRLKLETDELFIEWDMQRSLTEIRNALLDEIHSETTLP